MKKVVETMEVIRIQDRYNDGKVWVIKRSACGHYYANQENYGYMLNKKFSKTTKKQLELLGIWGMRNNG